MGLVEIWTDLGHRVFDGSIIWREPSDVAINLFSDHLIQSIGESITVKTIGSLLEKRSARTISPVDAPKANSPVSFCLLIQV